MTDAQPCRVLLVEDDPGDANLLRQTLSPDADGPYRITWVSNLADARRELEATDIDVVLLDLSLPDSSGIATVRAVCEAAGRVPLVVLTGHDDAGFALKTLEAGAQDYLVKGSEADALVRAIRHAVSRGRLEQALRASEERLRLVLAGTDEGWWDWDLQTNERYYSPRWWTMLGHVPDAFATGARSMPGMIHPEDAAETERVLAEALASDRDTYEIEFRLQHRNGHYVPILSRGYIVRNPAGKPLRVTGANMDLTERKQAERNSRLAVLGTLSAGAAHEINNPLTFIGANLCFLREELTVLRPMIPEARLPIVDEMLEAIAEARVGAERIKTIVAGLQTFSRPVGQAPIPVDVGAAVQNALKFARNDLRHRARVDVHVEPVPKVLASPNTLEQVFLNLLINASLAMPEGPIEDNLISVAVRSVDPGDVVVEVRDTGIGMNAEVLGKLFEPFFTTRSVGAGTGLGLSICHGIVSTIGGRIDVKSSPGEGSTFRVVLPAMPVGAEVESAATESERLVALPKGGRVLVVDDDPHVAKMIVKALADGPEVVVRHDARDALVWLEVADVDLILCDLMMPNMSGMEFHAALTRRRPRLAEAMVFITGGAFTPQGESFLAEVRNLCIAKPFSAEQLRRLIAERLALPGATW